MNLNAGIAQKVRSGDKTILWGPFYEYGKGSYSSHIDTAKLGDIRADGDTSYSGGGLYGRLKKDSGTYVEGSLRIGTARADYKSGQLSATFGISSRYVGAHIAVGKEIKLNEKDALDIYGKYLYTHIASSDGVIDSRNYHFNSTNSHRLRIGGRWTRDISASNTFYAGLAFQYEFGGKESATISTLGDTPQPSLKGFSTMGEVGWLIGAGRPFQADLGMTGWVGKQQGVQFHGTAKWRF